MHFITPSPRSRNRKCVRSSWFSNFNKLWSLGKIQPKPFQRTNHLKHSRRHRMSVSICFKIIFSFFEPHLFRVKPDHPAWRLQKPWKSNFRFVFHVSITCEINLSCQRICQRKAKRFSFLWQLEQIRDLNIFIRWGNLCIASLRVSIIRDSYSSFNVQKLNDWVWFQNDSLAINIRVSELDVLNQLDFALIWACVSVFSFYSDFWIHLWGKLHTVGSAWNRGQTNYGGVV